METDNNTKPTTDAETTPNPVLYVDIGIELKEVLKAYSNRTGVPFNFITKSALKSYLRKMCVDNEELEDVRAKLEEVLR